MKSVIFAIVCTLGAVACGGESAPAQSPSTVTSAPLGGTPDVAAANESTIGDRGAVTTQADRAITAAIRQSVATDDALSPNAKNNLKIVTISGKVWLGGNVKSEDEKSTVESKAKSTAGVTEVDNQLVVKE